MSEKKASKQRTRTALGKALAKLRIDLDLEMGEMADRLEITGSYLSRMESGNAPLTVAVAQKIMEAYSLDVTEHVAVTGSVTIRLDALNDADREAVLNLYRRSLGLSETTTIHNNPPVVSTGQVATVRAPVAAAPDVDGVGFIDDEDLGDLDDDDIDID